MPSGYMSGCINPEAIACINPSVDDRDLIDVSLVRYPAHVYVNKRRISEQRFPSAENGDSTEQIFQ